MRISTLPAKEIRNDRHCQILGRNCREIRKIPDQGHGILRTYPAAHRVVPEADRSGPGTGCGTGRTALRLADHVDTITASDVSPGMLAVGRRLAQEQKTQNVNFVQAEANQPPDWTYDVVMTFNLLHLVQDLNATLARVHQVLKPGGLFISKTPCLAQGGLGFKFGLLKLLLPVMQLVGKAPYVNQFDIKTLESTVGNAGFEIIESGNFPVTPPSRYLVARRV